MSTIIQNIVDGNKTLFTLKFPAQPQLGERFIEPSEAQMVVFTEGFTGYRGVKNAFALLDVLYRRGVTDRAVLEVLLEATGHQEVSTDQRSGHPENASEGLPDHA